ncbi:restriction endonuclease subunit S [Methanobrevibacter thaueri]|uniref:restriction endonuclease subunit S n=1 Tax=Methanobrevibacter thaueri TaxID=190975 RepID=UPI00386B21DE
MSLEWQDVVLKDVLSEKGYIRGPFGSALKRSEMKSEGIPVYEQQNAIYDNRIFRYYIDDDKYQSLKRFTTVTDDLIISCSGTVGKVSIIKENDPKGIISQALLTLRVNKELILPEFLKYFFSSYEGYNSLVSRSTGSVQVNISKRAVIEEIPLKLPPLDIQRNIVYYLQLIDAKIENCISININLFELSKVIHADFIKSMNNNDESSFIDLKELGNIVMGQSPKGDSYNYDNIGLPLINGAADYENGYLKAQKYTSEPKKTCDKNDLIFCIRATIGLLVVCDKKYCLGRGVAGITNTNPIYKEYAFHLINSSIDAFKRAATGSVISGISRKDIENILVKIPTENEIKRYHAIQNLIFGKLENNRIEITKLSNLRDTLLPKLMSGEIDVSKINCDMIKISMKNLDNMFTTSFQNIL